MSGKQKKRSGGTKKYGRCLRKNSKQNYKALNTRRANKRKRIAQSNGDAALRRWSKFDAVMHNPGDVLHFPRVKRNPPAPRHVKPKRAGAFVHASAEVHGVDPEFATAALNGPVHDKDAS